MAFLLSLLHAIVQNPKDYYLQGIEHCKGYRPSYNTGASKAFPLRMKVDVVPRVADSANRKILNAYPSMTAETKKLVNAAFADITKPEFWNAGVNNRFIAINAYDATAKSASFLLFEFNNEKELFETSKVEMTTITSMTTEFEAKIPSYFGVTTYTVVDGAIKVLSYGSTKKFDVYPKSLMTALAEPLTSLVYGLSVGIDTSFLKQAVEKLESDLDRYIEKVPYINDGLISITAQLENYLEAGFVDLSPIHAAVLKFCTATPTPTPSPEPVPAPIEEPELEDNEDAEKSHFASRIRRVRRLISKHSPAHPKKTRATRREHRMIFAE